MEACSSHGDRAGGVKRNRTAISVELSKQSVNMLKSILKAGT